MSANSVSSKEKKIIAQALNNQSPLVFLQDTKNTRYLRKLLQDPSYSLNLQSPRPKWQLAVLKYFPKYEILFGKHQRQRLQELGIIDPKDLWSERQFQKFIRLSVEAHRTKVPMHFEHLRLWMNDYTDIDGSLKKCEISFYWLLCNDRLSGTEQTSAKRIADHLLKKVDAFSVPIQGTIRAREGVIIRKIFAWMIPPTEYQNNPYLEWLGQMATETDQLDWQRFDAILDFIKYNWQKLPDHSLLQDYLDGYINILGKGKYRG